MAPEQYDGSDSLVKSDIFALGVILHELLTGGIHPIGEVTTDVWPHALSSKGKKWSHEDVWKKWARHPPSVELADDILSGIINKCLDAEVSTRHTATSLEVSLLRYLETNDRDLNTYLIAVLSYFDELASSGETGGWPYYEHLLEQVNSFDYS